MDTKLQGLSWADIDEAEQSDVIKLTKQQEDLSSISLEQFNEKVKRFRPKPGEVCESAFRPSND